jgi:hypothetical protein
MDPKSFFTYPTATFRAYYDTSMTRASFGD